MSLIKQGTEIDSREGNMKDKNEKESAAQKIRNLYVLMYLFIYSFICVAIKSFIHYSRFTE